ncbi:T9SS type A sorting domain-containing protein [bacterium]|nr:T9SS type A sorting domain-containing protein [bacterium]
MQKTSDHKKLESVSYAENSCTNSRLPKHYYCLVPRLRGDDEVCHLPLLIAKLSASIPNVLLLLSTLIFLAFPIPSFAQWTDGGMQISRYGIRNRIQLFPIHDGGFWAVYEDPAGDIRPKTWVQQFDSAGYAQFAGQGIPVIPDSVLRSETTDLFGAIQRPDGGIAVCVGANISEVYPWGIYAQAFNLEGEYLYGPEGAVVSEDRDIQWVPTSANWPLVKPDESGGFWVYYESPQTDHHMYVSGLNADGTRKLEEDHMFEEHNGVSNPLIGSDSQGGCYLVHAIGGRYYLYHILADGELENEESILIGQHLAAGVPHFLTEPISSGDVYLCSLLNGSVQKIDPEFTLPWGLEGVDIAFGGRTASPPLITYDEGVVSVCSMGYNPTRNYLFRLRSNGEPYYENAVMEIDSLRPLSPTGNFFAFTSLDCTEITGICGFTSFVDGVHNELIAYHFDSTSVNRWGYEGVMVDYRRSADDPFYRLTALPSGITTTDGSMVFAGNYQGQRGETRLYLYKLYPDGTVAGRENSVGDETQPASPKGFRLRSAFPNPFNGTVTLRVDLAYPGEYEWTVYSLTGQEVARNSLTTHHAGLFEQTWTPRESLASGVYLVRWTKEGQHLSTSKLVYLP